MEQECNFNEEEYKQLLEQISLGNESSFRKLYHCYYPKLLQFSYSLCKHKQAAEEITEDVFIKIWKNRTSATQIQYLRVYLYTAVKNTTLNYISQQARRNITEPFNELHIELAGVLQDTIVEKETIEKINKAIDSLPPRCKMIFKLIREDGLKYREVAEILNISPDTVDAQMTIAIRRISQVMKEDISKIPNRKNYFKKS